MSDKRFANIPGAAVPAPAAAPASGPAPTDAAARAAAVLAKTANPSWRLKATLAGTVLAGLFYVSAAAFVLLVILVLIHYTLYPIFSFSDDDPGIISVPTASDKQSAFTKGPANYDISANFVGIPSCSYTVGMDIYIAGDFSSMTVPRVLLYRALGTPGAIRPPATDTSANLVARFPNTNFLVWLDPVKNDLYVSGITTDGTTARLESIKAIQNVPIRQPFRLTVVFTPMMIEAYMNGSLEQATPFKQPLRTIEGAQNYFWPVISTIDKNTLIGNVNFWPRTLSSREVRAKESEPVGSNTFFSPTTL
jgi:hypothetical protein